MHNPERFITRLEGYFSNINKLSFEYLKKSTELIDIKNTNITHKDIIETLNISYQEILDLKKYFEITRKIKLDSVPIDINYTNIFKAIVQINMNISEITELPFSPSDVFQVVTSSLSYTNSIYFNFKENRMLSMPKYEKDKKPTDVFKVLIDCLTIEKKILSKYNVKMADIKPNTRRTY